MLAQGHGERSRTMKFNLTPLPGVILVEVDTYVDPRGYFLESYHRQKYADAGISGPFVQTNISKSSKGTLRGLHAQFTHPQEKLVHIIEGEIWDVAVDLRPESPTFKKWYGVTLSSDKPRQMYVPIGFGHGFCVLSDTALVEYKVSDVYDPTHEMHLLWNDPDIGIGWPIKNPVLSVKDREGMTLRQVEPQLKQYFNVKLSKPSVQSPQR
jgi:dTDP-4-dehydrorhamnose 3,5-epimerase